MSKAKHTPGPWKVVHNARNCTLNVVSAPDADGESVKIALVNYQDEGNANLIAAAPDMQDEITRLRAELAAEREELETTRQERMDVIRERNSIRSERDALRALLREASDWIMPSSEADEFCARIYAALKEDGDE